MKICPVGANLFHADGRTNGYVEANSRLSQFWEKAPKRLVTYPYPMQDLTSLLQCSNSLM